jgi:Zn-dependent protease
VNRHAITLGRILGIPIGLDYSWFLIFVLITVTLATLYYPAEFQHWAGSLYWIAGAVTAIMLFVSVLLHELGHAAVALRYKIPVRGITLFIFGGAAQITTEPPSAGAEFWIAIAGPIVSLAVAILYRLMQPIFGADAPLSAVVKYLAYINGTLALFNLIPGFPLDGGRVFRAIIWGVTHSLRRATLVAVRVGRFIAFLFIFVGAWQMLTGHLGNGLWIACVGWFLASAATSQVRQQTIRNVLAGHRVADAMSHDYAIVPGEATLRQLMDVQVLDSRRRSFVQQNGQIIGLLTPHRINEAPRAAWPPTITFTTPYS